jgi:hypothetical protein
MYEVPATHLLANSRGLESKVVGVVINLQRNIEIAFLYVLALTPACEAR